METKKVVFNKETINFIINVSDDEIEVNLPVLINNNLEKTTDLSNELNLLKELDGFDYNE